MTTKTFETISVDQLAPVTGGGIGAQIGGLFGAKGAQWGGIADTILGMFKGGGGSSGGGSSGGGGGGGLGGILGNLPKLFSGGGSSGGGGSADGGGSAAPADSGAGAGG